MDFPNCGTVPLGHNFHSRLQNMHSDSLSSRLLRSNKYQERSFKAGTPPLPPRTQFLTAGKTLWILRMDHMTVIPLKIPLPLLNHTSSTRFHHIITTNLICHLTIAQNLKAKTMGRYFWYQMNMSWQTKQTCNRWWQLKLDNTKGS